MYLLFGLATLVQIRQYIRLAILVVVQTVSSGFLVVANECTSSRIPFHWTTQLVSDVAEAAEYCT